MIDLKLSTNRKVSWASLRKEESESDLSSQSAIFRGQSDPFPSGEKRSALSGQLLHSGCPLQQLSTPSVFTYHSEQSLFTPFYMANLKKD